MAKQAATTAIPLLWRVRGDMACYLVNVPDHLAAECEYCKERLQVKLPLRSKILGRLFVTFEDAHKYCKPSDKS